MTCNFITKNLIPQSKNCIYFISFFKWWNHFQFLWLWHLKYTYALYSTSGRFLPILKYSSEPLVRFHVLVSRSQTVSSQRCITSIYEERYCFVVSPDNVHETRNIIPWRRQMTWRGNSFHDHNDHAMWSEHCGDAILRWGSCATSQHNGQKWSESPSCPEYSTKLRASETCQPAPHCWPFTNVRRIGEVPLDRHEKNHIVGENSRVVSRIFCRVKNLSQSEPAFKCRSRTSLY